LLRRLPEEPLEPLDELLRDDPDELPRDEPDEPLRDDPDELLRDDPDELLRDEPDDLLRDDDPDELLRDEPDDLFLRLFFDFDSATVNHLAVLSLGSLQGRIQLLCFSAGALACNLKPLEQLTLLVAPFLLADAPLLLVQLELD
jgi:hypothetical protein